MIRKIFSLIILVLITSSCSIYHINSIDTTDSYYPSKSSASEIQYLVTIDQPHEIIGVVTINAERQQRSINEIIEKMKREAAVLGGDAITDIKSDATGVWKRLPAQQTIGNAYVRANFTTSVVIFK